MIESIDRILHLLRTNNKSTVFRHLQDHNDFTAAVQQVKDVIQTSKMKKTKRSYIHKSPKIVTQLPTNMQPEPRVRESNIADACDISIPLPMLPQMPTVWPQANYMHSQCNVRKKISQYINHIFNGQGHKMNIDTLLSSKDTRDVWLPATENELGRLSQGFKNRVKAQDALDFIYFNEVPKDRKVTYANLICDNRPLKTEKSRVRMIGI